MKQHTQTTDRNASIHPRAWLPNGRKKNTCAPRAARNGGAGSKCLRKCAKRLSVRIRVYEAQSNKQGYHKPGSMQP